MAFITYNPLDPRISVDVTPIAAQTSAATFRPAVNTADAALDDKAQIGYGELERLLVLLGGNGWISGGTISAGTGLSVNIAALTAVVGVPIGFDATEIVGGLVNAVTNYIFLREDGTWTVPAAGSSTPPLTTDGHGDYLLWGTATTAGNVVTGVSNVRVSWPFMVRSGIGAKKSMFLTLCDAFTPAATGGDTGELVVPYSPDDGVTSIVWTVRRIDFRVNVAGGVPAVTVEKSTSSTAFSASSVGSVTLGSGAYEGSNTAVAVTVASGDKLRLNPTVLGTATGWTVAILIQES